MDLAPARQNMLESRTRPTESAIGGSGPVRPAPRFEVIETLEGLTRLETSWTDLISRTEQATIFLRWEWVRAWLDAIEERVEPLVIAAYDGPGRLIGLAPFYRSRAHLLRTVPFTCLRMIGEVGSGAEYPDLIVARGQERAAIELLARGLESCGDRWDIGWLPNIAGWSGAASRFRMLASRGSFLWCQRVRDFGAAALSTNLDEYLGRLSSNMRSTLRRQQKRAGTESPFETRWCESADQIEPMLASLFELHQRRWATGGQDGCFERQPLMKRFYRGFAPVALRNGWLRLAEIRSADRSRAVQFGYASGGAFLQIQEGYDPDCPMGFGNLLRMDVLRRCMAEGLREYDFLAEFTEHKRRWGARRRWGCDVMLGRPTPATRMILHRPFWPTGRFLRPSGPEDLADDHR